MLVSCIALLLAYLLTNTGLAKAFDAAHAVASTRHLVPRLWRFAPLIAHIVTAAELGVALLLLTAPLAVWGLAGAAALLLAFLTILILARRRGGPGYGCGCGAASAPVGPATIGRNAVLLALCFAGIGLAWAGREIGRSPAPAEYHTVAVALVGWLLIPQLCLAIYVRGMERRLQKRFLLLDSPDDDPHKSQSSTPHHDMLTMVRVLASSVTAILELAIPSWFRKTVVALYVMRYRTDVPQDDISSIHRPDTALVEVETVGQRHP